MDKLLSTKEVAELLSVNEKMIYTLINEKGLPATKITGKWLFPKELVEQWVESRTINYPQPRGSAIELPNLLLVAGSNDLLLDRTLALFRRRHPKHVVLFGNLGSLGGLRALRQGSCHIASSHLVQDIEGSYDFDHISELLEELPAVVNFCRREQGLIVAPGNPLAIHSVGDLQRTGLKLANRPLEASTRVLLDRELHKVGLDGADIVGYNREFQSHLDIGLEVLSGRADAGPGIRAVASLLNLDFVPVTWERFDLLIPKAGFFTTGVQLLLDLLQDKAFQLLSEELAGYDLSQSGKLVYHPNNL